MPGTFLRRAGWGWVALIAAIVPFAVFTDLRGQGQVVVDNTETFNSGQSVIPTYDGWHQHPDGSIDMWFSYHNQNWKEEVDIPIGPNNTIEPFGPDAGQPTHFQPRTNRWTFTIRVPKDFGTKEVVWTLTSYGKTHRAYGTLKADYFQDDNGLQREAGVEQPPKGNTPPVVRILGDAQRTAKVGQPILLSAITTDDGLPKVVAENRLKPPNQRAAFGLRMSWVVYRGAGRIVFDPRQFKTWEDQRGGSASARRWAPPPVPPDNTWSVRATFHEPGEYRLQARASDGLFFTGEYVNVTVTP